MPRLLLSTGILLWACAHVSAQSAQVDFARDVYPIFKQHCFKCHEGVSASSGLRLDLRAEVFGETSGKPLVKAGKSSESRLIQVITGKVPGKMMPRQADPLSEKQISVLRAWIDQGVAWDDKLLPPQFAKSDHWAFQPLAKSEPPRVKNQGWVRNPVDAFIAAGHEQKRLQPAKEADRRTWLRRVTLDLTGLPPSLQEIDDFLNDTSPAARERVVERLLASPQYGERWARHWLDIARWAESEGYESNHLRPYAWRYRDYVVRAFNSDMPFDRFIREQLAGDEITPYSDDQLIATGFLAAARLSSNEEDMFRQRNDMLVDIVNSTSSALLGLTMQCAQCHNHKFDPLTARDYYRFQGFFIKGQVANVALKNAELWKAYEAKKPMGYEAALRERDALFEKGRANRIAEAKKELDADTLKSLAIDRDKRTPEQEKLFRQADLLFQFTPNGIENGLKGEDRKRYEELKKQVAEMEKRMIDRPQAVAYYSPATSPHNLSVLPMKGFYPLIYNPAELGRAKSYLLSAGDVHRPTFALQPGWPAVFGTTPEGSPGRLALAEWIIKNPLTARVYANRVWQHHFGRGIVATANDFGVKGAKPTHPELLDWLAQEFIRSGWSTKHLHRLIVLSSTYAQSAQGNVQNEKVDPDNHLWWHWQPRRLEAEAIRDSMLAVCGELDTQLGGPSATPEQKSNRRSLYLLQKRDLPPQQQALFDGPSAMTESCGQRQATTVPLQALYLLNSEFSVERARALAKRISQEAGDDRSKQIELTFRVTLGRPPVERERSLADRFFDRGDLVQFCQAMMNVNEFVYIE